MADDPLEPPDWALPFYQQVEAIAAHTAALSDEEKGIPAMIKTQSKMIDLLKGYEAEDASRGTSGDIPPPGVSPHASRTLSSSHEKSLQQFFGQDEDLNPKASVGGTGLRGNQWVDRVGQNAGFKIPQIGRLTGQDFFNLLANAAADRAMKIKQRAAATTPEYQALKEAYTTDPASVLDPLTRKFTPEGMRLFQEGQAATEQASGSVGNRIAALSNVLGNMGHGYAVSKGLMEMARRVADPIVNARNLAYLTGYQGGGQGPMGLPNLGAINAGFGQRMSELGFAANNNLSPTQAQEIYNNLFGLGWNGGSQTNAMRNALANLTNVNPLIGTNPATASMLDETVRLGQHSISDFVDVMKKIPDAAHAANLSLAQVQSDMQSMGNFYSSIGGSKIAGMQASQFWNQTTGLSSQIFQGLLQNPLIKGQVFMGTGLMPFEQGLATPAQQMQGIFNSLDIMRGAINLPSVSRRDVFGVTHTTSSQDRQAALIASQWGTTPDVIKNLIQHKQGIEDAANILQNAQNYQADVQSGKFTPNGTQWDLLKKEMNAAVRVDPTTGKVSKIFKNKDIADLNAKTNQMLVKSFERGKELRTVRGEYYQAHNIHEHGRGSATLTDPQIMQWALQHGRWTPNADIRSKVAKERADFIGRELGNNANQNKGPQITVELGPAARKVLHLSTPQGAGKAGANAGGSAVNIPWAQGPTPTPTFSDPNTAGGGTWGSSASQQ